MEAESVGPSLEECPSLAHTTRFARHETCPQTTEPPSHSATATIGEERPVASGWSIPSSYGPSVGLQPARPFGAPCEVLELLCFSVASRSEAEETQAYHVVPAALRGSRAGARVCVPESALVAGSAAAGSLPRWTAAPILCRCDRLIGLLLEHTHTHTQQHEQHQAPC